MSGYHYDDGYGHSNHDTYYPDDQAQGYYDHNDYYQGDAYNDR